MGANRLFRQASAPQAPSSAPAIPNGFVLCPPQLMNAAGWQQEIYRQAYQRACQQAAIPRHYRMLFSVWN